MAITTYEEALDSALVMAANLNENATQYLLILGYLAAKHPEEFTTERAEVLLSCRTRSRDSLARVEEIMEFKLAQGKDN